VIAQCAAILYTCGSCVMSITAAKPATTPIPVQLSATECTTFLWPHLSMPKRGPQCELGYHRVFNLTLWVLYTGMRWPCLPIPLDADGKPALHYTDNHGSVATPIPVAPVNEARGPVCVLKSLNERCFLAVFVIVLVSIIWIALPSGEHCSLREFPWMHTRRSKHQR
jgi:hypothetical protein